MYQYKPEVDKPIAEVVWTENGSIQLKVYGITVESKHMPFKSEGGAFAEKANQINARADQHPDRIELREHRSVHDLSAAAMRAMAAAYQRLLKVIEKTKPVAIMRKSHGASDKSTYLNAKTLLREGSKLYADQFVLPAHMLYELQRGLSAIKHDATLHKFDMNTIDHCLKSVETTMKAYDLEIPHPAELKDYLDHE